MFMYVCVDVCKDTLMGSRCVTSENIIEVQTLQTNLNICRQTNLKIRLLLMWFLLAIVDAGKLSVCLKKKLKGLCVVLAAGGTFKTKDEGTG